MQVAHSSVQAVLPPHATGIHPLTPEGHTGAVAPLAGAQVPLSPAIAS